MYNEEPRLTLDFTARGVTHVRRVEGETLSDFPAVIASFMPVIQTMFPWVVAKTDYKGRIYFDVEPPKPLIQPFDGPVNPVEPEPPVEVVEAEKVLYEGEQMQFQPGDKVLYFGDDEDYHGNAIIGDEGEVIKVEYDWPEDDARVLVRFPFISGHGAGNDEWWVLEKDLDLLSRPETIEATYEVTEEVPTCDPLIGAAVRIRPGYYEDTLIGKVGIVEATASVAIAKRYAVRWIDWYEGHDGGWDGDFTPKEGFEKSYWWVNAEDIEVI